MAPCRSLFHHVSASEHSAFSSPFSFSFLPFLHLLPPSPQSLSISVSLRCALYPHFVWKRKTIRTKSQPLIGCQSNTNRSNWSKRVVLHFRDRAGQGLRCCSCCDPVCLRCCHRFPLFSHLLLLPPSSFPPPPSLPPPPTSTTDEVRTYVDDGDLNFLFS